jgi:hypothetical protein
MIEALGEDQDLSTAGRVLSLAIDEVGLQAAR